MNQSILSNESVHFIRFPGSNARITTKPVRDPVRENDSETDCFIGFSRTRVPVRNFGRGPGQGPISIDFL